MRHAFGLPQVAYQKPNDKPCEYRQVKVVANDKGIKDLKTAMSVQERAVGE